MRTLTATLKSASPYSQSRFIPEKKTRDESFEDFEIRCWRQRCHVNKAGEVYIPRMALKNTLVDSAKYKPEKIKGAGNTRYTKHIIAGVICDSDLPLGVHIDDVESEWWFVSADGIPGGSKRVSKCFPMFYEWEGEVSYMIFDDIIPEELLERYLIDAGRFIGMGRFRPPNNGYFGRFSVESIKWS